MLSLKRQTQFLALIQILHTNAFSALIISNPNYYSDDWVGIFEFYYKSLN